jgi:hypothetical protein
MQVELPAAARYFSLPRRAEIFDVILKRLLDVVRFQMHVVN